MPPLTLPPRSPATLRAFWLTASGLAGLTVGGTLAAGRRDRRLLGVALPVAMLLGVSGDRSPYLVSLAYRVWNRLARVSTRLATTWVSAVAYAALLATKGTGALPDMPMRSTGGSAWRARGTQSPAAYPHQDPFPEPSRADAFDRFAEQPDHVWADSLRPLVRLLQAIQVEDQSDERPPADIYTLY